MNVNVLVISKSTLTSGSFDFGRLSVLLADRDYAIDRIYCAETADDVRDAIAASGEDDMIIAVGEIAYLEEAVGGESENGKMADYFRIGERTFVVMPTFDERKVKEVVIPLLNVGSRKCFNTVVFRTFGKSEAELRDMLRDQIRNRSKIMFEFYPRGEECEVHVRYSRSTSSSAVNDMMNSVGDVIGDYVYAFKDVSLADSTAELLLLSGAKLSVAESFTGGGLASSLIAYPGMSKCLVESVVAYSNEAKQTRLGVSSEVIEKLGAVSADCAFEMASGLLSGGRCDIAVATTGNAGPTAEPGSSVGLYYIAVGDKDAIHVYEHYYMPSDTSLTDRQLREAITRSGIETALFELGKYLKNTKRRN